LHYFELFPQSSSSKRTPHRQRAHACFRVAEFAKLQKTPGIGIYILIFIYVYTYTDTHIHVHTISAGPCLSGATRLRGICFFRVLQHVFVMFSSMCVSCFLVHSSPALCNCYFTSLVSAFSCFQVSCLAVIGPTDRPFTSLWVGSLNLGSSRISLEHHRISDLLARPSQIRKSEPKVPKKLPTHHPKVDWTSLSSLNN
jgi:hypothetical protein